MNSDEPVRTGMKRQGLWLIIAVILGATGLVEAGIEAKSQSPVFCASCHEMTAAYDSWARGSHQTTGCTGCHRDLPVGNMFAQHFMGGLAQGAAGGSRLSVQPVHVVRNCSSCHPVDRACELGNLVVPHDVHAQLTVTCNDCHQEPGHDPAGARVAPETCLECHNGVMASSDCATCHPDTTRLAEFPLEGGQEHGETTTPKAQ